MWKAITDCGKQLTVNTMVREVDDQQIKLYQIVEIEFDQYKLALKQREGEIETDQLQQVLTCEQLIGHHFEVEDTEHESSSS